MERGKNYTHRERIDFLEIVSIYKDTIENKRTDGTSCYQKSQIWKEIERKYNSLDPPSGPRRVSQLKMLYKNLKRKLKTNSCKSEKAAVTLKGDGETEIKQFECKLMEIMTGQTNDGGEEYFVKEEMPKEVLPNAEGENKIDDVFTTSSNRKRKKTTGCLPCEKREEEHDDGLSEFDFFAEYKRLQYENEILQKRIRENELHENLKLLKMKQKNQILKRKLLLLKIKNLKKYL